MCAPERKKKRLENVKKRIRESDGGKPLDERPDAKIFHKYPSSWMDNILKNSLNMYYANIYYAQAPHKTLSSLDVLLYDTLCCTKRVLKPSYLLSLSRTSRCVHYWIIWFSIRPMETYGNVNKHARSPSVCSILYHSID